MILTLEQKQELTKDLTVAEAQNLITWISAAVPDLFVCVIEKADLDDEDGHRLTDEEWDEFQHDMSEVISDEISHFTAYIEESE